MESESERDRHPVGVVAQRTGLTATTLRAWERRYGVVAPGRSEGGQRLYSDADIERLKLLRALTDGGRPIRLVAGLTMEDARALLSEDRQSGTVERAGSGGGADAVVAEALALTRALDGEGLHATLRRVAVASGVVTLLDDVIGPLLTQVGNGWAAGELGPAEEHLAAAVVESVLDWVAASASEAASGPTVVVGTLPDERHRLGARMVAASAAVEGWRVAFLGSDLPAVEFVRAARAVGAAAVAISVVAPEPSPRTRAELATLRDELPQRVPVYLGGAGAAALAAGGLPERVHLVDGLPGLREVLRRHR